MFRCLSWLPAYSVVAPSRPRRRPPYGRSGDERGWVSGPLQLIFGNSSRPHSSSWVSVTPPAHLWLTDCIVFVSSLIYTLICVSTIGFVNISFKIIKESQLVYFKFLNMIYCCFSQSLSVADLEPVRSGVFFVESGSDHIYRLLNLKNKGQQFPTNKHSYSYSMYFKKEVVSVYVVSTI